MWTSGNAITVTRWAILRVSADKRGSSSSEVTVGDRGNVSTMTCKAKKRSQKVIMENDVIGGEESTGTTSDNGRKRPSDHQSDYWRPKPRVQTQSSSGAGNE